MGSSWSSSSNTNRRRNQNHPPSQLLSSSSTTHTYSHPPPPAPYAPPPPPPYAPPYHTHPPPPPHFYSGGPNYQYPVMGHSDFGYHNQGWVGIRPVAPTHQPAAFVEEQQAKKVRNDVNVHKDSVKVVVDELNPDHHLVSFVFDALFDGSITIFYFAKEEPNCKFVPVFPESYNPVKFPFQKGAGQKFRQPCGTGIDLGFFELDDLSKPAAGDVFPLVISAETCSPLSIGVNSGGHLPISSPHRQITQAVLEKKDADPFKVRVMKQILWIDEVRYELREIYGIGNSGEAISDDDSGKECVICMTEPRDTAVLPCRHMCLCSECAKALRIQSNNCPICRQPIEELMEIKIDNAGL
ncbi:putative E3 ubiquitin-protein ligase LUL4 isoform X1 [Apium graveolens]|uniref:putative E3 ubiquitin-protein ligase LUL4 isoform X1 n=1 Tax=Apium graveolens TaxID=4045 RepID=UPI003D7918E8